MAGGFGCRHAVQAERLGLTESECAVGGGGGGIFRGPEGMFTPDGVVLGIAACRLPYGCKGPSNSALGRRIVVS